MGGGELGKVAQNKIVLGIDPSLSSTGYAFNYLEGITAVQYYCIKAKKIRGCARLYHFRTAIRSILDRVNPELVVYEDYSYGSKGRATYGIAELGGLFRLELYERGLDVLFVPPTSLKVFTANHGFADKETMIAMVKEKHKIEESIGDDEADAIALWYLGRCFLGMERTRTERKRDTLTKCTLVKGMK
jgi:Holliday junction resolvasome RuvABC endonuclease subunit